MYLITKNDRSEQIHLLEARQIETLGRLDSGLLPEPTEYNAQPVAIPAENLFKPYPRHEWADRLAEKQGRNLYTMRRPRLPSRDQRKTNFCWAACVARCAELYFLYTASRPLNLSINSLALPVTGGRNVGGWPTAAIDRLITHGVAAENLWPGSVMRESQADPAWKTSASMHRCITHIKCKGFDYQVSAALRDIPLAIPLLWWRHAVCQLELVQLGKDSWGLGIDNSWGSGWGEDGHGVLEEDNATADHFAVGPISMMHFSEIPAHE